MSTNVDSKQPRSPIPTAATSGHPTGEKMPPVDVGPNEAAPSLGLYWIPLGAGTPVVRWCGRAYERVIAVSQRRRRCDLYHSALIARTSTGSVAIEVAPVPDADGAQVRGAVGGGSVGSRLLGRWQVFRYEVRCWPNGTIPDLPFAVSSPVVLTTDPTLVAAALDMTAAVPTPVWGRDELGLGDMWNSNSVIAWVLASLQLLDGVAPPANGRAPGWDAGVRLAGLTAIPPATSRPAVASRC